jgi:hypothetical protein
MKPLFLFCSLLIVLNVRAQIGAPALKSAASTAMGGAGVAFSDINGIFHNTASTASVTTLSAIVAAERHFLGSPIQTAGAGIVYPSGFGAFGLNVQYSGIDLYNTQKIGLSYGRKLFDHLSIGAQFDAINVQIKDYGAKAALTFEAGLLAQLTHDLHLGFQVFSPANVEFVDGEPIPTVFTTGIAYLPSSKTIILAEVEQNIDRTARFKAGVAYQFLQNFALRAGVATQPTTVSFGTGLALQNGVKIDVAASYHTYLGITPSFSVRY